MTVDSLKAASLRGFDVAVADIGDQLHLRHPLLSFDGDSTLYVARRFNWRDDPRALAVADPSEASELATLLPDAYWRQMESGDAVVVAGAGFVQAATNAGIQLETPEMSFARIHKSECWISTATQASFTELRTRLADEALVAFDEALGGAARERRRLSDRGSGALLVLRGCGTRWREDLAIRELACAKQNREFDLYRRQLDGFAIELDAQPDDLHRQVERHIDLAVSGRPEESGIEQNREFDLLQEMLDKFAFELRAQLDDLRKRVEHIELAVSRRPEVSGMERNHEYDLYRRLADRLATELDAQPGDVRRQVPQPQEVPRIQKQVMRLHNVLKQLSHEPHPVTIGSKGTLFSKLVASPEFFHLGAVIWREDPAIGFSAVQYSDSSSAEQSRLDTAAHQEAT